MLSPVGTPSVILNEVKNLKMLELDVSTPLTLRST